VWPHPWYPAAPNAAYDEIVTRHGELLSHGHNSFFDLIPEIGVLGVAIFALVYVQAGTRVLALRDGANQSVHRSRLEASRITLLGIVALLVFGLSEPLSTIPLGWFTLVVLATGVLPRGVHSAEDDSVSARRHATREPSRRTLPHHSRRAESPAVWRLGWPDSSLRTRLPTRRYACALRVGPGSPR